MTGAHTPGPWAATKAKPRMVTASGVLICTAVLRNMGTPAQNKRGKGQEEAVANARLIAAAPDLLGALQESRTTLSILRTQIMVEIGRCADPSESRWEGVPEKLQERIAAIDAAIAAATGEGL